MAKKVPLLWQFEEHSRVAVVKLTYVRITGDLVSALLLTQIVYWFTPSADGSSKLHVFRNGRFWLAKSREDWERETGLTRRRFDRACDLLESMGILDRSLFKWRGAPTIHIGLNINRLSGFVQNVQNDITKRYKSKDLHETYKSITETTKNTSEISKGGGAKSVGKADEALKAWTEKHQPSSHPTELKVKNAAELAKWWARLVPYYHDGVKMKGNFPTGTDLGQLAKYLHAVGKQRSFGVMHWAIRNWDRFALDVSKAKGQTTAQLPHIGALLQHHDVALAGYNNKSEQLAATDTDSVLLDDEQVKNLIEGGKGGGGS